MSKPTVDPSILRTRPDPDLTLNSSMKNPFLCLGMILFASLAHGDYVPSQSKAPNPEREFRGVWVATVHNIDWPSRKGLSASQQKEELVRLIDSAARVGINAVVFQIRTECDAFYPSKYEPWSAWLTGKQGPSPGYDPLQFAILEAHKRGMELHAWFNPFRASASDRNAKASNHISRTHPSLMLRAGTQVWANPASEFVRTRALNVITDVVRRYDIDAVHLDDYFYPYPKNVGGGKMVDQYDDSSAYQAYRRKGGRLDLRDWRRSNIDGFVNQMYRAVKSVRPSVKVGISPFGIWRPGHPRTVEASLDAYHHICADSRKWLREGWVDYFSPQLYWTIDDKPHSFTTLSKWWAGENVKRRHLWPGIASARIGREGRKASESIKQIEITRTVAANPLGSGHIHWNYDAIGDDRGGIRSLLGRAYAPTPLTPASPWLGTQKPKPVWVAPEKEAKSVLLKFSPSPEARWRYVQYRRSSGGSWRAMRMIPAKQSAVRVDGHPHEIAIRNVSPSGVLSDQTVIRNR